MWTQDRAVSHLWFPATMNYSIVCGRIYAYQRGLSGAFAYSVYYSPIRLGVTASIESPYVSGLSLTHGLVGQRKHVWTFAGPHDETVRTFDTTCPCTNPAFIWTYQLHSYVGVSYFCNTGAHTGISSDTLYKDNPLWDGEGCGTSSTCCSFNSPPWFCEHLKHHTSDDLELRLCSYWGSYLEDKLISLVEIYVK